MKLHSLRAELSALQGICSPDLKVRAALFSILEPHHFHLPECLEAVKRIKSLAKHKGEVPEFSELVIDPVLSEDTRSFLSKKCREVEAPSSKQAARKVAHILLDYYRARATYKACVSAIESLKQPKVDVTELMTSLGDQLAKASNVVEIDQQIIHIGLGNNADSSVKNVLKGKTAKVIPTGIKPFDERSGGFLEGGLAILTANTGGLKSVMAKHLASNFFDLGNSVIYVSLEMDEEEVFYRLFSARADIENIRFVKSTLSKEEKRKAWDEYERMVAHGKKHKARFSIMPVVDADLGIDQILAAIAPYGYKVVIIDYVSLLADADNDEQWKSLGKVARKSKMFAKKHKCLVILLAQLSDDDKIRYSRAISEHANYWWLWRVTPETRETGIFTVQQGKARNQEVYSFDQMIDWPTLRIKDPVDAAYDSSKNGMDKPFALSDDEDTDGADKPKAKKQKPFSEIGSDYYDK